ncbi:MAG TPA: triose-phosphate isomerase [Candidatus Paceibacterota bacterium]|nr:triose-phosphate isomerase [Candidatus Paceibacterota bacterium]
MLILANWKAYVEDAARAKRLAAAAKRLAARYPKIEIALAPCAPHLGMLAPGNRSRIAYAAQDLSATTGGAQTGEVSAQVYADLGAAYAIVGHSERRAAGESGAQIAQKLQHAIAHGLAPVLCVGERERDAASEYLGFVRDQITAALAPLSPRERRAVIFAYEPVWAIGKSAAEAIEPADLAEMLLYIRKIALALMPGKGGTARVLYGGSVEAADIRALAGGSQVDGFLVGHASVDAAMFSALVKALA